MHRIKVYYRLIKPGIVYSNAIATMAGFFLASTGKGSFDPGLFLATIFGVLFVISSACVLNNYIDRKIDSKMKRTQKRATVLKEISASAASIYAIILGLIGFGLLVLYTNWLTVGLGVLAYLTYIVFYSVAKRKSVHGTLVGAISGGLPPVAGYVSVTNAIDLGAILLFVILVYWQMPHFYAIAMRRRDEYAAANIPVLPVVKGMYAAKMEILVYIVLFIAANSLLVILGYTGYTYLVVMTLFGLVWLGKGIEGFKTDDDVKWARKMFLFSLIILIVLCLMIAVGGLLP